MKKVLIIDDENLVRRSLERVLHKADRDLEVLSADNGVAGKKLWLEAAPDLVIVDVMMPELNGLDLIEEIPDNLKKKVILISAHHQPNDLEKLGIDLFISKPFEDIFSIQEKILEVLG